jgi:3'-phosphoadenosine 5'-phosphosulfate sulfotransferase (PAPS reductase)/FAD synthetase
MDIDRTKWLIEQGMRQQSPHVVAWSGGKDSMALLHLLWSMGYKMPVMQFKEPWQPWKYEFQDRIIREWKLEVYTWHPTASLFQNTEDEWEVQNYYRWNNTMVTCPTGITDPCGGDFTCALDIYARPKQEGLLAPWQTCFVGHKGCDSDPIYGGDAGTRIEMRFNPNAATMIFPLRDWTHEDVWRYIEQHDVPYDSNRYEKVDGVWGEKADRSKNCDYVAACVKCLNRKEGKFVHCPKHNMVIESMADRVQWADQSKPSYMKE